MSPEDWTPNSAAAHLRAVSRPEKASPHEPGLPCGATSCCRGCRPNWQLRETRQEHAFGTLGAMVLDDDVTSPLPPVEPRPLLNRVAPRRRVAGLACANQLKQLGRPGRAAIR